MIGLFIGSFNPPTMAHVNICLKLKNNFEKIVLVPVNSKDKELISMKNRIDMLNILKNKYPFLEISNIMKDYSYLNYRIIDLLKKEYGDLNIIMGSDLLEKLDSFDNYRYLLDNYSFTIVPRGNTNIYKLINDKYSNYQKKISVLDYQSDISSTEARELLHSNKDLSNILDNDICQYIKENDLY